MGPVGRKIKTRRSHIFAKERYGHYVEPAWVSRRLFEVERFTKVIYDPACGWGTILKEALEAGYQAFGSDVVSRRHYMKTISFEKRDFLGWPNRIAGSSVVCNPPFDYVQEFCKQALDLGAPKVAMICLVRRLNAAHWLEQLPLQHIWLLTPRPSMPPGSWIAAGNKPGGGTNDFCWLIFERKYKGRPMIGWLHRDKKGGKENDGSAPR
jgi:hypothetical protein